MDKKEATTGAGKKEMLDRTHFGFRKGKGTFKAIYVLTEIIEKNISKCKVKVIVCFADMRAAFDKLRRNVTWESLREKKVEEKIIRRLEEIYEETFAKIMIEEKMIDEFEVTEGVR